MATALKPEETIALLSEKAKQNGDNFWVKVFRQRGPGLMADAIATFSQAQVRHFQHPEMWLPRLLGGGPKFLLRAYDATDPTLPVGDLIEVMIAVDNNPPKSAYEMDLRMLAAAGWTGPQKLEYPTPEEIRKAAAPTPVASYNVPSAPPSGNSAANNVPGGGLPTAVSSAALAQQQATLQAQFELKQQMQAMQAQIDAQREMLAAKERELEDTRRRAELDAVKRDAEERAARLEAKLEKALAAVAAAAQAAPAPRAPTLAEQLPALATAFAPIFSTVMDSNKQSRELMMQQSRENQARTDQLLTTLLSKPAVDPMLEKTLDRMTGMLDKARDNQTAPHELLHNMSEAMQTMTAMTLDLAQAAAEVNGGAPRGDHPAVQAIKQGLKAVTTMMEGYQQGVQQRLGQAPYPQPQQLPPQRVTPQQAFPQQPPQQAPRAAPQPANVVQFPPQQQPVAQPQVADAPAPQQVDSVTALELAIKAFQPPAVVAKMFIDSLDDDAMTAALDEVDGDPNELVAKRLGGWVMATPGASNYLGDVLKELQKQGLAAGIFGDEDGGDDGDDDQDDAANGD